MSILDMSQKPISVNTQIVEWEEIMVITVIDTGVEIRKDKSI